MRDSQLDLSTVLVLASAALFSGVTTTGAALLQGKAQPLTFKGIIFGVVPWR